MTLAVPWRSPAARARPVLLSAAAFAPWAGRLVDLRVVLGYEAGDEARATADRAVRALAQDGIKASGEARNTPFGHAAREIVGEARDFGAGVIVVGSRGHGDLAGLVLGSTAHKVIHLADRPVLVVR